ncbi:hypothetical protein CEXT_384291 [Caerostris extrusa]|uniref:Uncharacterized protein n=1 Tax=Caerostris extrusa TaxID=172846 RepID=A0AAV4WSL0_CAEEX|nr:hypothetical protein CEXT_384291 [Caerostris extrusa]
MLLTVQRHIDLFNAVQFPTFSCQKTTEHAIFFHYSCCWLNGISSPSKCAFGLEAIRYSNAPLLKQTWFGSIPIEPREMINMCLSPSKNLMVPTSSRV